MTKALATIMYTNKVSEETIRTVLMIAAINDLVVKSSSILNVYVLAPVTEKV